MHASIDVLFINKQLDKLAQCFIMLPKVMKNNGFNNYLKIKEAANYLGVSRDTLRQWDAKGKLKSFRHPINGYRLYRKTGLDELLIKVNAGA